MSKSADKRWEELTAKLRKLKGYSPLTPEEAEKAYANAPEEQMSDDEISGIVEQVVSGELASWAPSPDLGWLDDMSLSEVEEDALLLHRNAGESDPDADDTEDELRKEMLEDDDEDAAAGGSMPTGDL